MADHENKDVLEEKVELDIVPEDGELEQNIKDKQIFGVYKDEEGADRAIRQLNKLGYSAEDIYIFTQDEEKTKKMKEGFSEDFRLLSCSDGSDFIGSSYDSGDVVICVLKDTERFRTKGTSQRIEPAKAQTTMDVVDQVSKEKRNK